MKERRMVTVALEGSCDFMGAPRGDHASGDVGARDKFLSTLFDSADPPAHAHHRWAGRKIGHHIHHTVGSSTH
jgi:hypothetical protein